MNLVLAGDIFETPGAYIFLISIDSHCRFILDLIHMLPLSEKLEYTELDRSIFVITILVIQCMVLSFENYMPRRS